MFWAFFSFSASVVGLGVYLAYCGWPLSSDEFVVERLTWKHDSSNTHLMTEYLAANSRPVILTDTPLNHWDFSSWTFEGFSTHLRVIPCKISSSATIRYHALDKPLQAVPGLSTSPTHREVIMNAREFFQRITDNNDSYYYYSSGDVSLLKLSKMPKSLSDNLKFPPYQGSEQINYWFGSTNVTAYPHYDTSHNLHIVVRGKKRFIVYPPSSYKDLILFPCLHSLYRQVQVDVFGESTPAVSSKIIIDVNPGEVLYLPPYWFHSVVTVEPSLSLNIWCDSADYTAMEDILNSPIPFEASWSLETLVYAAKIYIEQLLLSTKLGGDFITSSVLSRYTNMHSQLVPHTADIHPYYCSKVELSSELTTADMQYIVGKAESVSTLFGQMSSVAILEINMANYIEHILYTILREEKLAQLPSVLQECFQ